MDDQMTRLPEGRPPTNDKRFASEYGGLGRLLHIVRWTQHLLAIIAEALILLSFAMSGMDVSLGGVMAGIPLLKVLWAAMFALGIDTAFALSWVRVRQHLSRRQWGPFTWNLILALSMSLIVFQPIAVQLMQQTLDISFSQAVTSLGINIVLLTYARSAVAVFLGAILAMTNVESDVPAHATPARTQPKRQFVQIKRLFDDLAPVAVNDTQPALEPAVPADQESSAEPITVEQFAAVEQAAKTPAQPELLSYDTPEQRAERVSEIDFTGLSAPERVAKVLELFPYLSDRELGKLSGVAAATAKKHHEALKAQAAKEDGQ
jgi:hypothetical protein